jgi:multiple sugar transport system ATP-binding protein
MNMLEARIERRDGRVAAVLEDIRLDLDEHPFLAAYEGRSVVLGIRPEDLEDAALAEGNGGGRLRGRVELREALGSEVLVHFAVAARQAATEDMRELAEDVGDDRVVEQLAGGAQPSSATLVGRFSPRTQVVEGDAVEVSVDRRALHFFDPQTGLAIRGA